MPEGDTIHKLARALSPGLAGQRPSSIVFGRRHAGWPPSGRISAVYARGKHLFIEFDDGEAIRTHLGMYGSWHRYALDEPWKKPARQASVILQTDSAIYVCFNARELEVLRIRGDSAIGCYARSWRWICWPKRCPSTRFQRGRACSAVPRRQ